MKNQEIKFEIQIINKHEFSDGEFQKNLPVLEKRLEHLEVGDLMIVSDVERKEDEHRHLSASKFLIVDKSSDGVKFYRDLIKCPNDMLCIPLQVAQNLATKSEYTFIQRYKNMFKVMFYLYSNAFKCVELDREIDPTHLPQNADLNCLKDKTNNLRLFYFFENPKNKNDPKFNGEFLTWTSGNDFSPVNEEFGNLKLSEDNEQEEQFDSGLSETLEDIKDRDLEMEEYNKKFKQIYENDFLVHLKSLQKEESLCATSLPTKPYCKDTFEEDMMNSTTLVFYFDSLDLDPNGNINAIVVYSFDKSTKYYFTPYLCDSYGPFYKITLYTCMYNVGRAKTDEAQHFFLDLPVQLYNILDSEE